jgi:hypothetical protein
VKQRQEKQDEVEMFQVIKTSIGGRVIVYVEYSSAPINTYQRFCRSVLQICLTSLEAQLAPIVSNQRLPQAIPPIGKSSRDHRAKFVQVRRRRRRRRRRRPNIRPTYFPLPSIQTIRVGLHLCLKVSGETQWDSFHCLC